MVNSMNRTLSVFQITSFDAFCRTLNFKAIPQITGRVRLV